MKNSILLLLVLTMVGSAWPVDRNWTGAGDKLWTTAANWSGSVVPTSADKAAIRGNYTSTNGPHIGTGANAVANQIVIGDWSSTNDNLTITGGSLTTSGTSAWVILGYGAVNRGTITMSGGTVTIGQAFYIGYSGTGTLTLSGGTITVAGACGIAQMTGGVGDVFLNGGTLTCNGGFAMTSGAGMDVAGGTLIVNGDVQATLQTYINNGWITAYAGSGTFSMDYNTRNAGKTTLTASQVVTPPGQATTPNPGNGATGISVTNDLGWTAGARATSHDVYFGTSSPGTFRGNQTTTSYDTGTMASNTTYYWRIDEKNSGGTTQGAQWSFTTATVTGVDRNWTGAGDKLWKTGANWSGNVVPNGADKAAIRGNYTAANGPHIDSTTNAVANQIVVGDWSSTVDNITMTGGTLTTNSWFILGYGSGNNGTLTISGGTLTVNDNVGGLYVGLTGTGTLNMDGGTVNVANIFGVAQNTGGTGYAYLDGGTLSCGALNMTSGGRIDITAGTLIVNGDAQTQINGYRTNGWFTAYGGSGTFSIDYNSRNPGKTTVTATASSLPGKATNPTPPNGATGINTGADIIWTPGAGATSHDVYFGTVNPPPYVTNVLMPGYGYDPGTLLNNKLYYWRINEKNSFGTTVGDVWSFTTVGTVTANRRKGPYLIYPNNNTQMTVLWQLDATAGCTIAWGTDTAYSTGSAGTSEYGTDHQHKYNITGLTPGTRYYYRVTCGSNNWTGNFNAAPASTATALKFFMYGDTRSNGGSNNTVCGQMVSQMNSDNGYRTIVLHAGDWVSSDGESQYTGEWYNYSWTNIVNATSSMAFMGCIGNHEGGASIWKKYHPFNFPSSRYYFSFDYGPLHVAVVDQYTSYTSGSAQYNWLVNDLSSSTKPFKIIVLHQPGWSCNGGHGNDGTVQSTIQPLAIAHGVQIVLGGHNHYYSRGAVGSPVIQHLTAGGGGAPLYTPASGQPNIVTYTKSIAVTKAVISGSTMTCTTVNGSGGVIDTFTAPAR